MGTSGAGFSWKKTTIKWRRESEIYSDGRAVLWLILQEVLHDFPADGARKEPKKRVKRRTSSTGNK